MTSKADVLRDKFIIALGSLTTLKMVSDATLALLADDLIERVLEDVPQLEKLGATEKELSGGADG